VFQLSAPHCIAFIAQPQILASASDFLRGTAELLTVSLEDEPASLMHMPPGCCCRRQPSRRCCATSRAAAICRRRDIMPRCQRRAACRFSSIYQRRRCCTRQRFAPAAPPLLCQTCYFVAGGCLFHAPVRCCVTAAARIIEARAASAVAFAAYFTATPRYASARHTPQDTACHAMPSALAASRGSAPCMSPAVKRVAGLAFRCR
jgi:hypothetical protein